MQRPLPRFRSKEYFVYKTSKEMLNTQIYRDLYGDAMLVLIRMGTNMADGNQETSVTEFCYNCMNSFFEELINIKVILFLIHKLFT